MSWSVNKPTAHKIKSLNPGLTARLKPFHQLHQVGVDINVGIFFVGDVVCCTDKVQNILGFGMKLIPGNALNRE